MASVVGKVLLGGFAAWFGAQLLRGATMSNDDTQPIDVDGMSNKQRLYAQLRSLPMLTETQRLFLMLVAHGESNYNPRAFNASAGEAAAAGVAYDRLLAQGRINPACGYTREQLATGSGGRFGRLVPYFVNDLRELVPCVDPKAIGGGVLDIVSAIANARALQRYPSWDGTIGALRGGFGTPAWLDGPPADKLAKWAEHADEGGFSGTVGSGGAAFLARRVEPFTANLRAVLTTLQGASA